tara:strand:- start:570 stop:716 length:147 start_codon:yes stop_codon:yes gene_type:complete
MKNNRKEQIKPMLELLESMANKQRAEIYKQKYLKQKRILDKLKLMMGI